MRYLHNLPVALGLTAAVFAASAQTRGPVAVPPQNQATVTTQSPTAAARSEDTEDVEFLTDALRTGLAEMAMGELAQQRAANPAVRDYGKKLQTDHSRAVQELKVTLGTLNVTVPDEPSVEAEGHHAALAQLSGAEFDAAFLPLMIDSHEEAIEQYSAQTHANPNKQLSDFAEKALPMLREHLAIAQSLTSDRSGAQ